MTQVGGRSQSRADSAEPRADLFPGSVSTLHPDAGFGGMGWGRNRAVSAEAGAAEARGNKEATLTSELVPRLQHTLAGPPAVPGSDEKVWLPRRRRPAQGVQMWTFPNASVSAEGSRGGRPALLLSSFPLPDDSPCSLFPLLFFLASFLSVSLSFLSYFPFFFPRSFLSFFLSFRSFFLPLSLFVPLLFSVFILSLFLFKKTRRVLFGQCNGA